MTETLQEDAELATAYSAYQQARHRLTERYKNRGFWPARPFAGNAPKGKGYGGFKASGKGKSFNQPPPTTTVITEEIDPLPLEFRQLPMSSEIMPLEVIDCEHRKFCSAKLDQPIAMHLTSRGLFLVDLNEIALSARRHALHSSDLAKPALQQSAPSEVEDLSHLTLPELENEVITFGSKYNGMTHSQAWPDQEWCQFMLNRYGNSTKTAHRRAIRFIELKIEQHEQSQMPIPKMQSQVSRPVGLNLASKAKAKPQAKAKGCASHQGVHASLNMPSCSPGQMGEDDDVWDWHSEMYASETMMPNPLQQDPDFIAMRDRMLFMENALQRVIQHIEQNTNTAEPVTSPEEFP
ncbi:unnamed protein product [Cladocopium goreaui]|uniref:Uncharacterized protein n=1 Tax=Cladocopium goreaui TaxID=2562237 RepID=A0A9P1BZW0_9DINO|nr:unnamed protein product [Cladocopium goreaui]